MKRAAKDHLGNIYNSTEEMLKHYNISLSMYYRRKNAGMELKDILTTPAIGKDRLEERRGFKLLATGDYLSRYKDERGCYFDHVGNKFAELQDMCDAYGIEQALFNGRMRRGWPLDKALTVGGKPKSVIVGTAYMVFGVCYPDIKSICKEYGITYNYSAQAHNDDIEAWISSRALIRYKGKVYKTITELAGAYGLDDDIFHSRLHRGWTLERTLSEPIREGKTGKPCKDHNGKTYSSLSEMLRHYNVPRNAYESRLERVWCQKCALETPVKSNRQNSKISNMYVIELIRKEGVG